MFTQFNARGDHVLVGGRVADTDRCELLVYEIGERSTCAPMYIHVP